MTQEKQEELRTNLLKAIEVNAPEYKNLSTLDSEDIKQVLAVFFDLNILGIDYEEVESVNEVYFSASYYSEKLRKTIILDNDAPNNVDGVNNLIDYILDYEEEAEALENSIIIAPKEKRDAIIEALNIAVERDQTILEDDGVNMSDEDVNDYKEAIKFNQDLANSLIINK